MKEISGISGIEIRSILVTTRFRRSFDVETTSGARWDYVYRVARVQLQCAENEPYLVMKNQILQSLWEQKRIQLNKKHSSQKLLSLRTNLVKKYTVYTKYIAYYIRSHIR